MENKQTYQRITIVGCSGSGKTSLSFKLAQQCDLPLYHLDDYYWAPNWQRVGLEIFAPIQTQLCQKDRWIIEGTFVKLFAQRVAYADCVIFLDISRYRCLFNVIKRAVINHGCEIPGAPVGCKQAIWSKEFFYLLLWIWNFNKRYRAMIYQILQDAHKDKKIYILKSMQEINEFTF